MEKQIKLFQEVTNQYHLYSTAAYVSLIEKLSNDSIGGFDILLLILLVRKTRSKWVVHHIDGFIYEILVSRSSPKISNIIFKIFGVSLVPLKSQQNIDYLPLQNLLISKKFQEANALTHIKLLELSRLCDGKRSWFYFTDILSLPTVDLRTIDSLWRTHSLNRFGFSIQRKIWLSSNKDWNKLWNTIGWKINHSLRRYPGEFQWDLNSPVGHLPLFNQLYGIQPMLALFQHEAWKCL